MIIGKGMKHVLLVVVFTGIAIGLHQFAPDPLNEGISPSIFYRYNLFIPMITINLLLTFGLLALVAGIFGKRMSGNGYQIGLRFGFAFSILWMLGFLEGSLYYGSSIKHDIMHGLADGVPMIILLTIWGKVTIRDSVRMKKQSRLFAFVVICLFHLCGRYFMYLVLGIDSRVDVKPLQIFIWTVSVGLAIGYIYHVTAESLQEYSVIKRASLFSLVIFGIDWVLFYSFAPLIQETSLLMNFVRPTLDIIFVFLGVIVHEKMIELKSCAMHESR